MSLRALGWSPWLRVGIGLGALVGLATPLLAGLVHEWTTRPSLSHGFVVPLISAFLVWARWRDLSALPVTPSWTGLPVLVGVLAVYVIGGLANEPFVSRLAFLACLPAAVLFLAGPCIMRALLPAMAYLVLMMPLPYLTVRGLTDHLRLIEASTTAWVLPLFGVPVLQDGFLLHLANMTLEVAEVCSSIPAIMSLLALGAAFGYITHRPRGIRVALIVAAVPLGFLSNIARITLTAAGVYYIGPIAIDNVLHAWHGTAVFVMTVGALVVLDSGLMRLRPAAR